MKYYGGKAEHTPEAIAWQKSAWEVDEIDDMIDPDITKAAMDRIEPMIVGDIVLIGMRKEPKELTRCLSNILKLRKRSGKGGYEVKTMDTGVRVRRVS